MVKPGTAAAAAVPRSLPTPRNALPICLAVWGEITCRSTTGESELMVLPSAVVIDFTIRGVTSLPPFVIAAMATVICKGVTPISWPIGMRVIEILLQACGGGGYSVVSPRHLAAGAL